ncbi:NAD dependent epimerase/dehydratase [Earliella scabrosa]|nr:NAD dependent epimerase/dehydratase [Earliella scabrosa]
MPAISEGKVLVTGINGFIAGWIAKELLEHGFSVRGTVRSLDKAAPIAKALASYSDRLEFVSVEDITKPGAFDEAVKGVDAIVHAASPVHLSGNHPDEYIRPALDGTTSILHSASVPGLTVQRIVIISSLAAVVNVGRGPPMVFDETDWNETAPAEVAEKGADARPIAKYHTSKKLAEQAAWDHVRAGREKGTIGWDLVSLCPPWVFGPVLGAQTPKDLNFSIATWFSLAVKEEGRTPGGVRGSWTDVRDFAFATRAVLVKPEAGGERFIISKGTYAWQDWVNIARRLLNKPASGPELTEDVVEVSFNSKKSQDMLGIQYRDKEETAAFMIDDFKKKGWC